jgi:hypothetical protein
MATADDKRRARHARYNASAKGQARNRAYEARHEDTRKNRWDPVMLAWNRRSAGAK